MLSCYTVEEYSNIANKPGSYYWSLTFLPSWSTVEEYIVHNVEEYVEYELGFYNTVLAHHSYTMEAYIVIIGV